MFYYRLNTKAKTVNKNLDKRPQTITFAKATKTKTQTDRNRDLDEAAPAATSDTECIPESWRTKNGVCDAITYKTTFLLSTKLLCS